MGRPGGSLLDSKGVARLEKVFGSDTRHQCRAAAIDHERFAGRRRSLAADALDAVAINEDVTRKRFGARAVDDLDIGEERACPGDPPDDVCSASLGISRTARRGIAQSDRPPRGTHDTWRSENSSCSV
jgi:hypothetical protein